MNGLLWNIDKEFYISFGNSVPSDIADIVIEVGGNIVQRVENLKYLSVVLIITWDGINIEYIMKKTKYLVFVFSKLSKTMSPDTLRLICEAFFNSIITYANNAWGGAWIVTDF